MISERTLRIWRVDALKRRHSDVLDITPEKIVKTLYDLNDRVIRLTQELIDIQLMKKG